MKDIWKKICDARFYSEQKEISIYDIDLTKAIIKGIIERVKAYQKLKGNNKNVRRKERLS